MTNQLFGWNLLYSSVSSDIKNNEDVLVCFTHLMLISNGFQCIGLGDSKNMDGNEPKSETLPKGWNDNYRLRYVYQGRLYNLQGTRLDDGIIINLIRTDERNVSMVQLNSRSVVQRNGTLEEMIPNNADLVKLVKEQLINKAIQSTKTKEGASQTIPEETPRRSNSLIYNHPLLAYPPVRNPSQPQFGIGPIGVGRNDLDPLAGIGGPGFGGPYQGPSGGFGPLGPGGGGMLFQPPMQLDPSRPGMPGGSIPPGARFDPFRPPDVDRMHPRRPNAPDNDEMPPPGFDDMFM